jgi:hypothetical protein
LAFDLSSGTWTIEFWFYTLTNVTAGNQCRILLFGTNGTANSFYVALNPGGTISAYVPNGSPPGVTSATSAITTNIWYHVAVVCTAGTASIYINGTLSGGPTAITLPTASAVTLAIGYDTAANVNYQLNGYVSNLRIVKGVAAYTGNFTPQGPLSITQNTRTNVLALTGSETSLLTLQNSTFIDNAFYYLITYMNPSSPTYYGSFNGSSQYLYAPNAAGVAGYANDFTLEFWMYPTSFTGAPFGLTGQYRLANGRSWLITVGADGYIQVSNSILASGSYAGAASLNTWTHVAWVRSGSTWYLYINGYQQSNPAANGTPPASTENIIIGANGDSASPVWNFPGYISNFRIVKGQALYTQNFTPSGPLTTTSQGASASNVSLLTLQDATIIDKSINTFPITNTTSVTTTYNTPNNIITNVGTVTTTASTSVAGNVPPKVNDYLLLTDSITNNQALAPINSTIVSTTTSFIVSLASTYLTNLNINNIWTATLWDPEVIPQSLIRTNMPPTNTRENLYYATLLNGSSLIGSTNEPLYFDATQGIVTKFQTAALGKGVIDVAAKTVAPIQFWN